MGFIDSQRVAKSPTLFRDWTVGAKVYEQEVPPTIVIDHFDKLYELAEVPNILLQVCISWLHIYSLITSK